MVRAVEERTKGAAVVEKIIRAGEMIEPPLKIADCGSS
jgi:hypothetical protein